jgi:hypothetical protein
MLFCRLIKGRHLHYLVPTGEPAWNHPGCWGRLELTFLSRNIMKDEYARRRSYDPAEDVDVEWTYHEWVWVLTDS